LKSLNLEPSRCEEILGNIFGATDFEHTHALVDVVDIADFASKLNALEECRNSLQLSGKEWSHHKQTILS